MITASRLLAIACLVVLPVRATDDPLAPWRSGVEVREVSPDAKAHTIHSYFNTCPESPDGRSVLFYRSTTANAHAGELRVRDRLTGAERTLTTNINVEDAHRVACQQWVSGGKRVVFHGEREGEWFVATVDVESATERVLARGRLSGWGRADADVVPLYGPHWNPGAHRDLELLNVETGKIETVLTADAVRAAYPELLAKSFGDKPFSIFFPILSPDRTRVFFKLASPSGGDARSTAASRRLGLVCYSLAERRFLFQREKWGHPAWHPDGRTIVETGFTLIDSDDGQSRRIPGLPAVRGDHPSASPAGKLIVTDTTLEKFGGTEKEWGIVVADARGNDHVIIHRFDNSHGAKSWRVSHPHPVFSPDGRRIYFNVSSGQWTTLRVAEHKSAAARVAVSPLASEERKQAAPQQSAREPVALAKDAPAAAIDGTSYDLVVVGGTASGVVCAVRAAREGCSVLLVQHNRHIGGMMINGLMQWDALYGGPRAPLFTELLGNIEKHYIATSGRDSRDHQTIRYTHEHYPISWAEPHVAEREFNRLVAGEKNITLLLSHYPVAVERAGTLLRSVVLRKFGGSKEVRVRGTTFADATYEGDLFALAKVPYRVGREARDEYNEPHAGKVFCNVGGGAAPRDAVEGRLNIRPYNQSQGSIDPASPFTADGAVQAYNYRFCVTRDPANRVLPEKPATYNRDEFLHYNRKSIATNAGPNLKSHMNSPILPGENHAYPEASWPERETIIARHRDFALGLMWFLQNDESVSKAQREKFREWGLARDEFPDHGHIPYEMYVREARRIVGRHVLTEHDCSLAPGFARTPIMRDSIATTDWYMDSHACTTESRPGFHYDGKLILTEESRPAQIPYRALLPQGVNNLLVPVCLSATHIAWGAVRLEPVWMQTGEAAGLAAALAHRAKVAPSELDPSQLVRALCERRHLVSFFNDMKVDAAEPWIPAAEYFATMGFFSDYNANAAEPLRRETASVWLQAISSTRAGALDPNAVARSVAEKETASDAKLLTTAEFEALLLGKVSPPRSEGSAVISRGDALLALWEREVRDVKR